MTGIWLAAAAVLATGLSSAAGTQTPASGQAAVDASRGDALSEPSYKGPEVLAFIGVKPGQRVADVIAGRFTRALSRAVGPKGVVYAVEPTEVVKVHPQALALLSGVASDPAYGDIRIITAPIDRLDLPGGLDAVFIRQNYHDLHDAFMGPADVAAFNRKVFQALRPGGVFVVLDHAAPPGSGIADTETLHRIDPAAVMAEVEAAGFVLDGTSAALANPADQHVLNVFNPAVRGRTDQFLLRFRRPID